MAFVTGFCNRMAAAAWPRNEADTRKPRIFRRFWPVRRAKTGEKFRLRNLAHSFVFLLQSPPAFGICPRVGGAPSLPLLGCGCSSVVEHDLAKVGVEGSSPFARSRIPAPEYSTQKHPPYLTTAALRPYCRAFIHLA
jgi:hypothetical protein